MARGWDSKAVEDQIVAAEEKKAAVRKPILTPAERELQTRRDTLLLSRAKVQRDLQDARDDRHRAALQSALQYLDAEIANVSQHKNSR